MNSTPEDTLLAEVDLADVAARFGHLLAAAGVATTPERAGRFAAAIVLTPPGSTVALYWLARVTLVTGQAEIAVFDRVFDHVFGGVADVTGGRGDPTAPPVAHATAGPVRTPADGRVGAAAGTQQRETPPAAPDDGDRDGRPGEEREVVLAAVSGDERLRTRDFARLTPDELERVALLMRAVALAPPPRRSRRRRAHRHGHTIDLRATLAAAHRTGGDALVLARRRHRTRPRRLVFLCDISGSMEPYARAYLQLMHAAATVAGAEGFVFGTQLTRVTRELRSRRPDDALDAAGTSAPDWSGGTRIGAALAEFTTAHGRGGMARGAVVVIVSDGWESGEPETLGSEMARLGRLAHRIVWVNPRRASPRYEPLAAGMAAALPHVDAFVSGHSLEAVEELVSAIASSR